MNNSIAIIWHIEDIKWIDDTLTDDQARDVLRVLKKTHDASIGINWDVIRYTIREIRSRGEI